ncbi:MAG: hypothetical protein AAGD96_14580 [Chloroflexota bacterium]
MNEMFPFIMVLGCALLAVIVALIKHTQFQNRIAREIMKKGLRPIEIERRWLDFDENTATYDVSYQDNFGTQHKTSCKIRSIMIFFDGDLYWTKPFASQHVGQDPNYAMTQQLLIDALRKENSKLKAKIKQLEATIGS